MVSIDDDYIEDYYISTEKYYAIMSKDILFSGSEKQITGEI